MKDHENSDDEERHVSADDRTSWDEVRACFQAAEEKLTLITSDGNGSVPMPAINELRYAGNHLLRAQQLPANSDAHRVEMVKALRHCQRALFDVGAAGLPPLLGRFEEFNRRYAGMQLVKVYPQYGEYRQRFREIQDDLAHHKSLDRYALDSKMIDHLTTMQKIVRWLDDEAEPEMSEAARKERDAIVRQSMQIAAAVVSAVGALVAAAWALFQWSVWGA